MVLPPPTRPSAVPEHSPPVVRVDVPADDQYLQFLRVSAAAACTDVIDDLDRLDEIRLAVDELAVGVIEAAPPGRRLVVTIETAPTALTITGRVAADGATPRVSDVGAMLLSSIGKSYRLAREDGHLMFELVLGDLPG